MFVSLNGAAACRIRKRRFWRGMPRRGRVTAARLVLLSLLARAVQRPRRQAAKHWGGAAPPPDAAAVEADKTAKIEAGAHRIRQAKEAAAQAAA